MHQDTRIAVIEIGVLRETIREILREELERKGTQNSIEKPKYSDTDELSVSQVAEYQRVSPKTVSNYRKAGKIPSPKYNLSGKPRWTILQLQEAPSIRKAKHRFPVN